MLISKQFTNMKNMAYNSTMKYIQLISTVPLLFQDAQIKYEKLMYKLNKIDKSIKELTKKQDDINNILNDIIELIPQKKEYISSELVTNLSKDKSETENFSIDNIIVDKAKQGLTSAQIAKELNQDGIINQEKGTKWHWMQIEKKLKDFGLKN